MRPPGAVVAQMSWGMGVPEVVAGRGLVGAGRGLLLRTFLGFFFFKKKMEKSKNKILNFNFIIFAFFLFFYFF